MNNISNLNLKLVHLFNEHISLRRNILSVELMVRDIDLSEALIKPCGRTIKAASSSLVQPFVYHVTSALNRQDTGVVV